MTARRKKKKAIEISFSRPDNLLHKRRLKKKLVWFLFIILLISLGLSIYFGIEERQQDNTSALLSIEAEPMVVSGEEVMYKIFYRNKDEVDLTKLSLTLSYPKDFIFSSASLDPVNEGHNYWEMEDLESSFGASIEVRGRLLGDIGDQKTIKAVLAYEPANFSSTFTQEEFFTQEISSLKVDMWVDTTTEAMPAQEVQFRVHILNKQTVGWQPLVLVFNSPDQFNTLATEPAVNVNNNQWNISTLEPEEEMIITIMGELAPEIDVTKLLFIAELFEEIDGVRKLLDEDELPIDIINPIISVDLSLADEDSAVVDWGEIINYELVIKNEGKYVPDDLRLILVFDTDFINWQTWQDTSGLYREDNKIIWTKEHPKIGSKLANLKSGEEIRLKIGAKLQSAPIDVATLSDTDLVVASVAKIEGDVGIENFVTTSDILRSKIGQSLDFVAKAKYYNSDGEVIGSGPLPPQVNKATTYVIEWSLMAGSDNWQDVSLVTTLPPYIQWLNDQDGYTARFDSSKNELTIDTSVLNVDEELTGSFMISIIPDKSQVGQILALLNPMTLEAIMLGQEENITKQIDMVDTNLIYDARAKDKARVVE